jgi:lysophospholipase L1-like esterase
MPRWRLWLAAVLVLTIWGGLLLLLHGPGMIFSEDGRLIAFQGRDPVPCPSQTAGMAVILAAGQSNIANHAERKLTSTHPGRTFATFAGRCYALASPLLGASGDGGEFLTRLADLLIEQGSAEAVVIAPVAVGGTSIAAWTDGPLRAALQSTAHDLAQFYRVTQVLWQQGESDTGMPEAAYVAHFRRVIETLRAQDVGAPVYVAISTYCLPIGPAWRADNAAAKALQRIPAEVAGTHAGPNLDILIDEPLRLQHCHLSARGQEAVAQAWATVLATDAPPL